MDLLTPFGQETVWALTTAPGTRSAHAGA